MSDHKPIYGNTTSINMRKSSMTQDDPSKGDFVHDKEKFVEQLSIPRNPKDIGAQPEGEYLTEVPEGYAKEKDIPNVPEWAMQEEKPNYTAEEVGLDKVDNVRQYSVDNPPPYPVESVNGKTGKVDLNAADVGARPADWMPTAAQVGALPSTYTPPNQTAAQVGADPAGTAASAVSGHNTSTASHEDIRLLISGLTTRLNALANSTDEDLDQMAELVAYIKSNKALIDGITTSKVNVTDIVNNLTTNVSNKPLSAAQGVVLKTLIDALSTGKLDASKLPEAISSALAQAQASGEFDGDPGKDGVSPTVAVTAITGGHSITITDASGKKTVDVMDGDPGYDGRGIQSIARTSGTGAAGTTDTYTITYTDGSKSTFGVYNGKNGNNGASVTVKSVSESTADGGSNVVEFSDGKTLTIKNGHKGNKGDPGATPKIGIDYWTEEDQEAISDEVNALVATEMAKRGQLKPEFANAVDECTDTSKLYVLPDGYIYGYTRSLQYPFTNQIPLSINSDKNPYVGANGEKGYKAGYALISSGAESPNSGHGVAGFIPIKKGDVVRFHNFDYVLGGSDAAYFALYKSSFEVKQAQIEKTMTATSLSYLINNITVDSANRMTSFTVVDKYNDGISYLRISAPGLDSSTIVTVNEEIVADGVWTYAWTNTGCAFVPANYEDRIISLENTAQNHESRISNLEQYGSGSSSTSADIPAYIAEEAESVLNRLMEKQGNRVFNMVAMSDFHYTNYASKHGGEDDDNRATLISVAKATSYMLDRVHIDAVATLGDNTPFGAVTATEINWGHKWHKEINEILSMTQRPGVVDFRTVGNHDRMGANDADGNPTPILPDGAVYQYIQGYNRQCDYLSAPVGYGYKDFAGYKLRVIVLNTAECEGKGRFDGPHYGYFIGNAQYNWLINHGLDMSSKPDASEWQILLLSHHRADDVQLESDGAQWRPDSYLLPNILHAYKTGGSYSGKIESEGISVSCNFSGKNQARLIGQIHGHHHGYQYYNLSLGEKSISTSTTIMAVGTPTTGLGTTNPDNDGVKYTSTERGTAGETTFCVYAIDLDEHKIYSINYGKGIDREISY